MEEQERVRLLGMYRDGYAAIAEALLKITPEELDARPGEGRWSTREIVHHLADSELSGALRLRVLLTEKAPLIQRIDQDAMSARLHYDRPHESSLELFRYARAATAEILERMAPDDWLREGTHSELGPFSVERWLSIYAEHAHRHARQIREARAAAVPK